MYDCLFRPFEHAKLSLPNRIVMPPMTRGFSPDGVPGTAVADYYRRRAEGGVGLIISEGTTIDHPAASENASYPRFHGEDALAGWRQVIDAVHGAGGKMVPQIWHQGAARRPGKGAHPEVPSAAPSGLVAPGKKLLPELTQNDIADLVDAYASAALSAKLLGFDGVEIHGAHGYLVDNFLWEGTNQRTDRYGGSIEKRAEFALEIVREIRRRCGEEFPIIFRFSQWKQQDYSARLVQSSEQLGRLLLPLADAGVDIFHCSTRRFWEPEFEGSSLNLAGWAKKLTGKPVISVGSVGLNQEFIATFQGGEAQPASLDELIARMEADEFDLIAVGRALIANPDWVHQVQSGRFAELKPYDKSILAELY
jgi:2,4-dienoyl-CoA reductase-like NADH-dependent reductase (Old Yellow Enzyme family)